MIREVVVADAKCIADIYNYYVENTAVTFETNPSTSGEIAERILKYTQKYPWIVCEIDAGVVGYAYASPFRERAAYRFTAEISVYFDKDFCGRGYGKLIVSELLKRLEPLDIYTVIAGITEPNGRSENLFRSLGFEHIGTYKNVGYKNGSWHNVQENSLSIKAYHHPIEITSG